MIIGITGYGGTGASAYIDLLKEYSDVQSYASAMEFQLLQQPDGILDLYFNLVSSRRRLSSNTAITRFKRNMSNPRNLHILKSTNGKASRLTDEYINELIQVSWRGYSLYDPNDIRAKGDNAQLQTFNRIIRKILSKVNRNWHWPIHRDRFFSILDEGAFVEKTHDYLTDILTASGFDMNKPILLEQVFNTSNPADGMVFFDDPYSIVVDRDPRDVFILTNFVLKRLSGYMPHGGNVKDFVKYFRALHTEQSRDPRVRYVRYEDLIYHYEETASQLCQWLGLQHVKKGEFFKPEYSINNTQMYLKYPDQAESIAYIEREMADLLYPFDEAKESITFTPVETNFFHIQPKTK